MRFDLIWFDSTRNEKESNHQTVCVCCQNRNNVGNRWLDFWLKVAISSFLLKLYGPSCLYSDEIGIIGFPKHCSVLCGLDRQTESHEKRPSKGRWTCVFCVNLSRICDCTFSSWHHTQQSIAGKPCLFSGNRTAALRGFAEFFGVLGCRYCYNRKAIQVDTCPLEPKMPTIVLHGKPKTGGGAKIRIEYVSSTLFFTMHSPCLTSLKLPDEKWA